ncbi:hypothetical protein T484DRAFT_1855809 [Baffinella frigidus]|nr:hypothetical protein T484DRAFT_1855809 [Cryptophyta sp. CCMP2293]
MSFPGAYLHQYEKHGVGREHLDDCLANLEQYEKHGVGREHLDDCLANLEQVVCDYSSL